MNNFVVGICLLLGAHIALAQQQPRNTVSLSVLTYNVAGLPDFISGSNPAKNTIRISPLLNDYDLVLVQEDFIYHRDLIQHAHHRHKSEPDCDLYAKAIAATDIRTDSLRCAISLGDGLNTLSRSPFSKFRRISWEDCSGYLNRSSDCLTPKGFSVAIHEIAPKRYIHVYNLHADAGSHRKDVEARGKNFRQLAKAINASSKNAAIIVAGDTNSFYGDEPIISQFLAETGLTDVAVELHSAHEESIDKILYRSSNSIRIAPRSHAVESTRFMTQEGKQLSDHVPVSANFDIAFP